MDKPVDEFVLTLRKLSEESEKRIDERKVAVYKRAIDILVQDFRAELRNQAVSTGKKYHKFAVELNKRIEVDRMPDSLGAVNVNRKFMEDFVLEMNKMVGLKVQFEYVNYSKEFTISASWSEDS